mgnify:CR=1 FL=1
MYVITQFLPASYLIHACSQSTEAQSVNGADRIMLYCRNGGTCHDRVGYFICECPPGKTGLLCHFDDSCASNPCHELANCEVNPTNGAFILSPPPLSLSLSLWSTCLSQLCRSVFDERCRRRMSCVAACYFHLQLLE